MLKWGTDRKVCEWYDSRFCSATCPSEQVECHGHEWDCRHRAARSRMVSNRERRAPVSAVVRLARGTRGR